MARSKQVIGSSISIDLPIEAPEVKKKREVSDKQRENLAKGMAALKAKREAKSKVKNVEEEAPEPCEPVAPVKETPPIQNSQPPLNTTQPVAVVVKKERKPRVAKNYLSTDDFNSFREELFSSLKATPHPVRSEPVAAAPIITPQQIIQPTIIKERVISGSELLNRIFKF
jgi:hypothetical protein